MTSTGLDDLAHQRATALVEAIRKRGRDVRHEHTREVQTLSPEALAIIQRMVDSVMSEVNSLKAEVAAQRQLIDAVREAQTSHSLKIIQELGHALDRGAQALDRGAA